MTLVTPDGNVQEWNTVETESDNQDHFFKVTKNTSRYHSVLCQPSVWKSKAYSLYVKLYVFLLKKKEGGLILHV